MKLIRKLNSDDLISIVRNYFNVPEANIVCAHGQMDKYELEDVVASFINGD